MTTDSADWQAIAGLLADALRQCQTPPDWPMAWPDGLAEGTPWVDEALTIYDQAVADGPG